VYHKGIVQLNWVDYLAAAAAAAAATAAATAATAAASAATAATAVLFLCPYLHLRVHVFSLLSSRVSFYCPALPASLFIDCQNSADTFNLIFYQFFLLLHNIQQFIILATDGLWDVLSSQQAVSFLHQVRERFILLL
jgi:Protein phosphatase 2C